MTSYIPFAVKELHPESGSEKKQPCTLIFHTAAPVVFTSDR